MFAFFCDILNKIISTSQRIQYITGNFDLLVKRKSRFRLVRCAPVLIR